MKYYTCFLYADKSPTELHCTHSYFGPLGKEDVDKVIASIDAWFAYFNPLVPEVPTVPFIIEDFFGSKYKTRVLKPALPYPPLLPTLRVHLSPYVNSEYQRYRPHVTCNLPSLTEPFNRYALVGSGGIIIKEWTL